MNTPGCLINTNIIDSVLHKTKETNSEATIIFLDIAKAYDSIGHKHLINMLKSPEIPEKLQNILINLQVNNKSYIDLGREKSKPISINSGVLQGAPLSPILFNFCINHIFEEISEKSVSDCYGFPLADKVDLVSILGFADDIALIGKDKESATKLLHMVEHRFREIGLKGNPAKSSAIVIEKGNLQQHKFCLNYDNGFTSINNNERIKYLGVNFSNKLIFDHELTVKKFSDKLEILTKTNLLNSDQKLNVLNQYVSPCLIYPFQTAPLKSLNKQYLEDINKIIRSCVKEILQLPSDSPNGFLYSAKSVKGLQIFNSFWEAHLQQINKFTLLLNSGCKHLTNNFSKFETLRNESLGKLNLINKLDNNTSSNKLSSKNLRPLLYEQAFNEWCGHKQKGRGVILYSEVKHTNSWIYRKNGLSLSEWRDCLKMTCNVAPVRSVPGRNPNTFHCRYCSEIETLGHVLGYCRHGELLRNRRHNEVRQLIACALRDKGYNVQEEVIGLSESGSIRRIDIIAIDEAKSDGFIIDPTIRFESDTNQAEKVHEEKCNIYNPTINFYKSKFNVKNLSVIGLFFGARGTLVKKYIAFRKKFHLPKALDQKITMTILKYSVYLLRNHLYGTQ